MGINCIRARAFMLVVLAVAAPGLAQQQRDQYVSGTTTSSGEWQFRSGRPRASRL